MRAFTQLWDELLLERYGVQDPKHRRFRYGVQVNSLGLTEAQPENNVQRIVLEMLGVTLSKDARARAVQLPAWNEALGLPRPWDQQWSLRLQQVLAFETDLLEHDDLFEGSVVVERKVAALKDRGARGGRPRAGDGRRGRGRRDRLHEERAGRLARRAPPPHRGRRGRRRRRQQVHDHRAEPAHRRHRRRDHDRRPGGRAAGDRRGAARGAPSATPPPSTRRCAGCATPPRPTPTSWPRPSPAPRRASPRASGPARCARSSASTARPPASPARWRHGEAGSAIAAVRDGRQADRRGARRRGCASWSASPASTATATAPSRSPCAPATAASRSSTRASGSRPAQIVARRGRGGRPRHRPVDPVRLAHGGGAGGAQGAAGGRHRRRAGRRRRDHPRRRRAPAQGAGRRARSSRPRTSS